MFRQQQRRRQQNIGVYLLAYQLLNAGPIPPVTLATILGQAAIFLGFIPKMAPEFTRNLCLLPAKILQNGEYLRLIAPIFMHADDMHLYYNMISMLWKGRRLEYRLGAVKFASIIVVFTLATALMTVAVSIGLDEFGSKILPSMDWSYGYQCGVGFSGVLFALKVLCNQYFPYDNAMLLGWLPIPSRWACWAELALIQLITPNASFVGHLAGILVGLLYAYGPLEMVVDTICTIVNPILGPIIGGAEFERAEPSAPYDEDNWGRGETIGGSSGSGNRWSQYTGGLSEEEQFRRAQEESLRNRRAYGWAN